MQKIILVFGATGIQGGSVARQLLKDGEFKVRAATRDPSKESAKALDALGAEVVAVDITVQRDLDKAFDGVYGAFAVTNFWEHLDMNREEEDGKRMADTAAKYGVQHYLWSTVLNPRETTNGKVTGAAANQGKANVDTYIRTIPSLLKATTFISTGAYYTNFLGDIMKPRKEGGAYILKLPVSPETKVYSFNPDELGNWVLGIFKGGEETRNGRTIYAYGGYYTFPEWINLWSQIANVDKAEFVQLNYEDCVQSYGQVIGDILYASMQQFEKAEVSPYKEGEPLSSNNYFYGAGKPQAFEEWARTIDWKKLGY
ncbi:hypothetical protein V1506DRAFT_33128 [Lipomyces tetrasporus]